MSITSKPFSTSLIDNCLPLIWESNLTSNRPVTVTRDGVQIWGGYIPVLNGLVIVDVQSILTAAYKTLEILDQNGYVLVQSSNTIIFSSPDLPGSYYEFIGITGEIGTNTSGFTLQPVKQPDAYSFVNDINDLVFYSENSQILTLKKNSEIIFVCEYAPFENYININVRDLIKDTLAPQVPSHTMFNQTEQFAKFTVEISDKIIDFYVISGGIGNTANGLDFMTKNVLTNRAQIMAIDRVTPIMLTFAKFHKHAKVMLSIYKSWVTDADTWSKEYNIDTEEVEFSMHTLNTSYDKLMELVNNNNSTPTDSITHVDVVIRQTTTMPGVYSYSNPVRFVFSRQTLPFDDIFLFENAVGSIEPIVFEGIMEETQAHKSVSYKINDKTSEYRNDFSRSFKKNTGIFKNESHRLFASEFFSSKKRYHFKDGISREIFVFSTDAKSIKYDLNDFAFEFSYSEDSRYREVPRLSSLPTIV